MDLVTHVIEITIAVFCQNEFINYKKHRQPFET